MTPLEDFRDRLADLRRRCDRGRARGVAVCLLAGTSSAEFAALVDEETDRLVAAGVGYPRLDERWDAAIVAAGVDYLRRGWHLGPARVRPECSSQYHYVLDQDVRPEVVHREGSSRLGAHAAASVGLFGEALAGVVLGWMRAHGVLDPLGPWRLAAADGVTVAGPEHARWIVRPGPGGKRWRGVPLAEALRILDRNADYSAELDEDATAAALAVSTTTAPATLDLSTTTR